jgi:hypothetical protein
MLWMLITVAVLILWAVLWLASIRYAHLYDDYSRVNRAPTPKTCPECRCTRVEVYCSRCGWGDKSDVRYVPKIRIQRLQEWKAGERVTARFSADRLNAVCDALSKIREDPTHLYGWPNMWETTTATTISSAFPARTASNSGNG